MNRLLIAAAIGFLFAATATADPPVAAAPATGMPAPIVGSTVPAPMVVNTLTTPTRRGLFGRLRARNTNPMLTTTAAYSAEPTTMTPGMAVPAPMPPMPAPSKSGTSSAMPSVTGSPVVVGETAMTPDMTGMTTTGTTRRMGVLARLRMRRE